MSRTLAEVFSLDHGSPEERAAFDTWIKGQPMPRPSSLYCRLVADPAATLDAIAAALVAAGSIDGAVAALGVKARTLDRLIATVPALRARVNALRMAGKIGPSRGPQS